MKPRLKFTTDGMYTGSYSGNVEVKGKLDAYNNYMDELIRPDLWLVKFDLAPLPKHLPRYKLPY